MKIRISVLSLLVLMTSALMPSAAHSAAAPHLTFAESYDSVTVGGGGKYLLFHFESSRELVVFDVVEGKITNTLPNIGVGSLIAAGGEYFVVVQADKRLLMRWKYDSDKRDKLARFDVDGTVKVALLGSNADGRGPLLIGGKVAKLWDLETLKPLNMQGQVLGGSSRFGVSIRVSADGQTFGAIPTGYGPVAYSRMVVLEKSTVIQKFGSTSHATRFAQPTADGSLMLLPGNTIYGPDLKAVQADALNGMTCLPTVDPRFLLAIRFVPSRNEQLAELHVCTTGERQIIHRSLGYLEMAPKGNTNSRRGFANALARSEYRYHYLPSAKKIVTLPIGNQELFYRPLDVEGDLKGQGKPYLFVISNPRVHVLVGEAFQYKLETLASAKQLKFTLEDAPDRMRISRDGNIRWKAGSSDAGTASVLLTVTGDDGAESIHSFDLHVTRR
ncbi:MAG: hypothetical protein CMJ78_25380 [Planctomycetaceae bacterium]|nr:hypothetical protein [Planctomycetaceae bacterium]